MNEIREYLTLFSSYGVVVESFNDLPKFREMTEKLKVSASRELATENSENQVTRNSNKEAVPTSVELFNDLPKFREMNEKLKVSANKELGF